MDNKNIYENKIKHLELIQNNIIRMNQCSFHIKGLAITIVSALLALYVSSTNSNQLGNVFFIVAAIIPTIIFWFLDSYYLQQERKFRGIYNDVVGSMKDNAEPTINDFEMPLQLYAGKKYSFFSSLFSRTELPLYWAIITGLIILSIYLQ